MTDNDLLSVIVRTQVQLTFAAKNGNVESLLCILIQDCNFAFAIANTLMENITSQKILSPLLTGLLLMISLTLFAFEAHEQVYKFSVGKTTTAVEKKHYESLLLPEITICMEYGFKKEALEREGLPERFFLTADSTYGNNGTDPFPDLLDTWEKATYSDRELEITWRLYDGKYMQANILL